MRASGAPVDKKYFELSGCDKNDIGEIIEAEPYLAKGVLYL